MAETLNAQATLEDGRQWLIGVEGDGGATRLEHDYKILGQKQDRDGFEQWHAITST